MKNTKMYNWKVKKIPIKKQSLEHKKKKKKNKEVKVEKPPDVDDRKNWQFVYLC